MKKHAIPIKKGARLEAARKRRIMQGIDAIQTVLMELHLSNDDAVTAMSGALTLSMVGIIRQTSNPKVRKATRNAFMASLQHCMLNIVAPRRM